MKLFEYQAKELFREYGLPLPASVVVAQDSELESALGRLRKPVVLKSQVLSGGRGKAGGIISASDLAQAQAAFTKIMGLTIGGELPAAVLVEESFPHDREMYLSVTLDRGERSFVVIAATAGGVEVESLEGKVVRKIPLGGLSEKEAKEIVSETGLTGDDAAQFLAILVDLERMSREKELELAEINPLAVGADGSLMPLDGKVIVDDNALFRHPEFEKLHPEDEFEGEASRQGFAFVKLGGDIAVVGNGAGLVLSTLDLVGDAGGNPACFLDLGGGAQQDRIEAALRLVNRLPGVDRILVNIFGGITKTTDVAQGIKTVIGEGPVKPIFARVSGADEEEARNLLAGSPVRLYRDAPEAVSAVVKSQ